MRISLHFGTCSLVMILMLSLWNCGGKKRNRIGYEPIQERPASSEPNRSLEKPSWVDASSPEKTSVQEPHPSVEKSEDGGLSVPERAVQPEPSVPEPEPSVPESPVREYIIEKHMRDTSISDAPPRPFHPYYDLDPTKGQVGLSDPTKLKLHTGNIIANKDGQVIENLRIRGSVYVQANNVTIRNCKFELRTQRVSAVSVRALNGRKVKGLLISRTEFDGGLVAVSLATQKVYTYGGPSANRIEYTYMHGVGDGVLGHDFTLYRSRIETVTGPWGNNHSDGIQIFHTGQAHLIESYIDVGVDNRKNGLANAAVFIGQDFLPNIQSVHIRGCYLNGGGHTYRHWESKAALGKRRPTKCSVVDSWFGRDSIWDSAVGYLGADGSPVWRNNQYIDHSGPVKLTKR